MFTQQLINGAVLGAIYALIALGYTLVYGILKMINFAHSEVLMVGAFIGISALNLGASWGLTGGTLLVFTFSAAVLGAGIIGIVIERLAYRPLRHAAKLAPLISAIGVSILLQNIIFLWVNNQTIPFPQLIPLKEFSIAGASINSLQMVILLAAFALMAAIEIFVSKTKPGKAMRACADDVETAGLMGIDSNKIIALTFLIGGALAGAAGVLNGLYYGSIKYNMGFMPGVKAFTAAVLGGIGNIMGAVLGGFILGFIEVMAAGYLPGGAQWKDVFAFVVLIGVLLVRPSGLLGEKIAQKV